MSARRRLSLLAPFLLSAVVLTGCSAPAEPAPSPSEVPAEAGQSAEGGTSGEAPTAGLPNISDCDQVAAVVGDLVEGIPFDPEYSSVQSDAIGCVWATPADGVDALTDIQRFSVDITEGSDDIPDPDEAAQYGMDMYFTDPRLDALGGVGLWLDADSAAVGGGTGSVLVPGVEIVVSDSRWGQEGRLDKDRLVTIALALLDL
ncbi:hypothetical protein [Microbacterium sp. TNHR37B]|uniref:hypothetical protein n=1 Tax=Microbacterium sp. TNHR37B TaxID=1775956 RepID=UPI0007B1A756|nr:hypothetical protein [Microbacterium sp. TNHR37B]KZE89211.1 hypothetical protein AVP41_02003 [Microbacterium sp. TNHR37B]